MSEVKTAEEIIEEHTKNSNITIGDLVKDVFENHEGEENFMRIKVKKIVDDGTPSRKILDWDNCLELDELPSIYLAENPAFYRIKGRDKIIIRKTNTIRYSIEKGEIIPEKKFQKLLGLMKEAGDRLHEIRVELDRLEDMWCGTMEITI